MHRARAFLCFLNVLFPMSGAPGLETEELQSLFLPQPLITDLPVILYMLHWVESSRNSHFCPSPVSSLQYVRILVLLSLISNLFIHSPKKPLSQVCCCISLVPRGFRYEICHKQSKSKPLEEGWSLLFLDNY